LVSPFDFIANWPLWSRTALGLLLGALIGSFLATLVLRWSQDRSVARGRSQCDGCGRTLAAVELVPLLSFVWLRGRCRSCSTAINRRHPSIELAAAAIGAISLALVPGVTGLAGAVFGWMLLTLALLDAEHFWLPDALTLPLLALGLLTSFAVPDPGLTTRLVGAAAGYATLALIALGYSAARGRKGLGGGDPKLLAAIGAWLGWQALPFVLLVASVAGLGWAGVAALRGKPMSGQDRLPFGTLMAAAAWPIWLFAS
jgi:leader peptidase (prepilin peptidase)/N-methyltransferase